MLTGITLFIVLSGCDVSLEDMNRRIDGLEDRIEVLEELCAQINTNIASLQVLVNAVQGNDYITSVTPIVEGEDTVGYTITFTKSGPVTIYHGRNGEDGQDGADGAPGATPDLSAYATKEYVAQQIAALDDLSEVEF